jgi:prepilin-type N-terminal cleavage/methylation domain-containing protein
MTRIWQIIVAGILLLAAFLKAMDASSIGKVLLFLKLSGPFVPAAILLVIGIETVLGIWLLMPSPPKWTTPAVLLLFAGFCIVQGVLLISDHPPSCGCFGKLEAWTNARTALFAGLARNLLIIATGVVLWWRKARRPPVANRLGGASERDRPVATAPAGFTLIELIIVIAVIGALLSLLVPVAGMVRQSAKQVKCASNLRQIGVAMFAYSTENGGWIQRNGSTTGFTDPDWHEDDLYPKDRPFVIMVDRRLNDMSDRDMILAMRDIDILQCPGRPGPSRGADYVINAFVMSEALPDGGFYPAGPTRLSSIRRPAQVAAVAEKRYAVEAYTEDVEAMPPELAGALVTGLDIYSPEQLPYLRHPAMRVAAGRHSAGKINIMHFDGSVDLVEAMRLRPSDFDDGIRNPNRRPRRVIMSP